jgi:hypothetical protein
MSIPFILLPLFAEVLLTFVVMFGMMYFRMAALRTGEARFERIALRESNWPVRATQFANSFANQFELPVLFYVLTILEVITHHADVDFLVLAWIFVAMRVLQAFVHVTNNRVPLRGAFFGLSAVTLVVMWVIFIVRILAGLP